MIHPRRPHRRRCWRFHSRNPRWSRHLSRLVCAEEGKKEERERIKNWVDTRDYRKVGRVGLLRHISFVWCRSSGSVLCLLPKVVWNHNHLFEEREKKIGQVGGVGSQVESQRGTAETNVRCVCKGKRSKDRAESGQIVRQIPRSWSRFLHKSATYVGSMQVWKGQEKEEREDLPVSERCVVAVE